jgi:hypothetical protein
MSMTGVSPTRLARTIAALFLLTILAGVFAQGFVSDRLIIFSDAAATSNNILVHRGLSQLSFSVYLIEMVSSVATTALWYVLLRPVSKPIALAAAFIDLTGGIVKTVARVFYITPLFVLGGTPALSSLRLDQLQSIALILFSANNYGAATAMAFFGFSTLLNGYLIFRSTFLPGWLGVLAMSSGLCWLLFLHPPLGSRTFPATALFGLFSSTAMILWMLTKGVDAVRWKEQAGVARLSS